MTAATWSLPSQWNSAEPSFLEASSPAVATRLWPVEYGKPRGARTGSNAAETIATDSTVVPSAILAPARPRSCTGSGDVVEVGTPEHFFTNPQEERTKLFLSQIL